MNGKIQKIISLFIILIFVFCDFSVDVLYLQSIPVPIVKLKTVSTVHADVYCLPPNEGGQTPVFEPIIGFCTLPPLDSYGKCAAPYVYSTTNKVCILTPTCLGAEYWDANAKQCVAYTGRDPVPGDTTPVFPDNSCAVDLNGNGEVEQDEIFQCTQTPQGYICPQGQAECNPQYTQPTCSAGYTYNPATQKCIATVSCPSGGNYDTSTNSCYATPGISCPSDFTYNPTSAKCEVAPGCALGGTYNANTKQCESNATPQCPTGYTYNSATEKCESSPVCSQGNYNSSTDKCELSVSPTCSSPYTLGSSGSSNYVCYASPICPSGSTYNTTRDKCETAGSASCPSGYSWNSNTQKCESYPQCPSGGSYNPSLDKCTTGTIVIVSCPSGFTYNSSRNVCEASPTWIKTCPAGWDGPYDVYDTPRPIGDCHDCYVFLCDNRGSNCNYYSMCNYNRFYNVCVSYYIESHGDPECHNFAFVVEEHSIAPAQNTPSCSQGQYNSQTGMCEVSLSTSVSCPAGYVLAGNYCVSNATCISPGTLNTATDKCETTPSTYNCPSGFTWNSTTRVCQKDPACPQIGSITGTLNPSNDKCEITMNYTCPSGMTYNSSVGKCQQDPTCAAGGNLNTGTDLCETAVNYNCPTGYTYTGGGKCTTPSSCSSGGTLNTTTDRCETNPVYSCPSGYTYTASSSGGNSGPSGVCQGAASCPSGGTLNTTTNQCEANANCSTGTLQSQGCLTGYSCPLGNYQCQQVGSRWMCSPYQCITQSQIQDEGDIIAAGLEDDGERDANGNCLGTIYIFNGKKMRCRKSGVQTGFHNCCNESRGRLYDSTGSTGLGNVTDAIKAIAAVYQAIKLGSIIYNAQMVTINLTRNTVNVLTGPGSVVTYSLNSAEGSAIANTMMQYGTQVGDPSGLGAAFIPGSASKDVLVGSAMQNYIQNLGPQIAWAIAQLALSKMVKDPVLSSAVNLVGTVALMKLGFIPVNYYMIAFQVISLVMSLFMKRCDSQDIETSTFNDSRYCHEVGEYCVKKWPLVGCVQKARGFCCFNSKLARIIHEQGRPQLAGFGPGGGWGQPKNPNCRGFLPEEFQALDFNKIDLSEYVEDIQKNVRTNLQQNLQQQFNQTMQDLTGY